MSRQSRNLQRVDSLTTLRRAATTVRYKPNVKPASNSNWGCELLAGHKIIKKAGSTARYQNAWKWQLMTHSAMSHLKRTKTVFPILAS